MGEKARESSAVERLRLIGTQPAPALEWTEIGVMRSSITQHSKTLEEVLSKSQIDHARQMLATSSGFLLTS